MPPFKRLVRISFLLLFSVLLFNIYGYFVINGLTVQNRLNEDGENIASGQQVFMQQIAGKLAALSIHHHFSQDQFNNQISYLRSAVSQLREGQEELRSIVSGLDAGSASTVRRRLDSSEVPFRDICSMADQVIARHAVNEGMSDDAGRIHGASAVYLPHMQALHNNFREYEQRTEHRIERWNQLLIISMIACLLYLAVLVIAPIFRQNTHNYNELQRSLEEVKKTQALLHDSERKYRHLFEQNPLPMWIFDVQTLGFLEVNQMTVQHYGYSAEEFSQMTILDIRPESQHEKLMATRRASAKREHPRFQGVWEHRKKNGELIFVEIISHEIQYHDKPAMLILAKDITRNIELQNELIEEKIAHQREIARASIMVQEKERNEIGRELHDNVNQILTSVKLHLEFMANETADKEKHRQISLQMISSVIQEIRRLSRSLVPPILDDVGLVPSIVDLTESINSLGTVQIELSHETFDEELLPAGLKLTLLRIIQEQTTNILKYARATEASIELCLEESRLQLRITDNGVGFDTSKGRRGIGLTNITNRADVFHGQLSLRSMPGHGCELQVVFDLEKVAELERGLPVAQSE